MKTEADLDLVTIDVVKLPKADTQIDDQDEAEDQVWTGGADWAEEKILIGEIVLERKFISER